ncbi:MAG TPA: glutathione S-transferase [Burkholderiales bacterium]|nr:glutathione S-transferase [Burkholderiales bacterium]
MITVHHLNNSRSQRILWLLEELGLDYEVKRYQRHPQTMLAPPELRAVHPLGKSPVITDGNLTLAESGAIVEYLADRHGAGRLAPAPDSPERVRYLYWLHFAEGTAQPPSLLKLLFDRIKSRSPLLVRPIARAIADRALGAYVLPNIERNLDFMESELGKNEWFAGAQFSAADIQMSFPVEAYRARGGLDERRPRLMRFLEKIHSRPAYRRAIERGGEYALMR